MQDKIMTLFCGALLSVFALSGCVWIYSNGPNLVKDGKPCADIVISDKPTRAVKLASAELQTYIAKISGAKLAIVTAPDTNVAAHIYVGRSDYTDALKISDEGLNSGAFKMVSGNPPGADSKAGWLVLLGHDKDFTWPQYAPRDSKDTQRALKEWDTRTGEHWTNPNLLADSMWRYSPAIDLYEFDERGTLNAVYEFLRSLGVRWYMPGDLGEIVPSLTTITLTPVDKTVKPDFPYRNLGDYAPAFRYSGNRDGMLYKLRCGFDATLGIPGPHGLCNVYKREEFKKAHPEFSLCFSSQEFVDCTVKYARTVFDIYPDMQYLSLWPDDGYWVGGVCKCDRCQGQVTPGRDKSGTCSDYIWGFIERVAREVYKTHPDRKIICGAYSCYTLPPEKIAKFSPNVMVAIKDERWSFNDPEARAKALEIRKGWLDKLVPGNLQIYCHYLDSGAHLPSYYPHVIAEDLRSLKGKSQGEFIELTFGGTDGGSMGNMHAPGFNHLNVYVTSRYYWDADLDIDALLNEYYEKFYGPAAKEMKAFIEYSEANWTKMGTKVEPIDKALELLDKARQKVAADSVYGRRIQLVVEYLKPLKCQRDRLAMGRDKDLPKCGISEGNKADIKIDGKLDDKLWGGGGDWTHGSLKELETGVAPAMGTSFTSCWADNALYLAIRCEERDTKGMKITANNTDDQAIYKGDFVELLLETQSHSYYRIAIAPNGVLVDTDMKLGGPEPRWSSKAEVATQVGDGFWTVELRIPMTGDLGDPLNGVVGFKPGLPFYFNLCRQRVRDRGIERSAFSPTGKPDFYDPVKFGTLSTNR